MPEDLSKGIRFGIAPTYRCNLHCNMCNRWIDKFPWQENCDLEVEDVRKAGRMLKDAGLKVNKVRITGGEPTLHPQLAEICDVVASEWGIARCTAVLTNGTTKGKRPLKINARYKDIDNKVGFVKNHRPFSISPADLGLKGKYGTEWPCEQQTGCGRLFDAFGFSFCVIAGSLGRLLRIDPYSRTPVLKGDPEICKHCIFSIGRKARWGIWGRWAEGKQEPVTETFAAAEDRYRQEPFLFKLWSE